MTDKKEEITQHQETFKNRCAILDSWNVDVYYQTEWVDGKKNQLPFFRTIDLPFSAEEWCDLCMRYGDNYIGGCCGDLSAVQDAMNLCFRDGGEIEVEELAWIAETRAHHGDTEWKSFQGDEQKLQESLKEIEATGLLFLNPWDKLIHIWHVVDGFYLPEEDKPVGRWSPKDAVEDAFLTLSRSAFISSMRRIFEQDIEKRRSLFEGTGLAKIAHALTITKNVVPEDFSWEGFCLYDSEKEKVAQLRKGYLCIYETEQEAEEVLKPFKNYKQHTQLPATTYNQQELVSLADNMTIKRLRITKTGTEILD